MCILEEGVHPCHNVFVLAGGHGSRFFGEAGWDASGFLGLARRNAFDLAVARQGWRGGESDEEGKCCRRELSDHS